MRLPTRVELRPQDLPTLRKKHTSSRDRELADHTDIPSAREPLILRAHLKQDGPESAPSGSPGLPRCGEGFLILGRFTKHGLHFPSDARLSPDAIGLGEYPADLDLRERRVELRDRGGGEQVHAHGEYEQFCLGLPGAARRRRDDGEGQHGCRDRETDAAHRAGSSGLGPRKVDRGLLRSKSHSRAHATAYPYCGYEIGLGATVIVTTWSV